ncbi:MAG UNVERIFIED_CONTAM: type III pantothenate kinase, partial [Thermobifida fusca]
MLLTIDVGNSDTVFGLFEGEDLLEHWRVSSKGRRTADEWAVVVQNLLHFDSLIHGDIDGIAMCCTVPMVQNEMRQMFRRHYGDVPAVIVEPGVKTGVPIRMDNPKEVGSDRIVNALAAAR